jgi:hypothetical protein
MVNKQTGFRRELDVTALRAHDWNADLPEVKLAFESLFYWPTHRADLIAFPGPPGKTWIQSFQEIVKGPDLDMMELFRLVLGYGTLYKVGYRERGPFFETDLGRGSMIWDKEEGRVAFWMGAQFPDRPLFGFRPEDGPFLIPMPRTAQDWKIAMDYEVEVSAEEFFEARQEKFESLFEEIAPELEDFVRRLRIVRWEARELKPGGQGSGKFRQVGNTRPGRVPAVSVGT